MASRRTAALAPSLSATTRSTSTAKKAAVSSNPSSPENPGPDSANQSSISIADLFRSSPTTVVGARNFLLSQRLLDNRDDIITPAVILNILAHIAKRPEVTTTLAAYIDSVALILPGAIDLGMNQARKMEVLSDKLDKVLEQNDKISELRDPPDLTAKLADLESKLGALSTLVEKSQEAAGAAESASIETHKSMIELHQSMTWDGAAGTSAPGPVLPGPPTFAAAAAAAARGPPTGSPVPQARPLSAKAAVASAKRAQSQGVAISIQPSSKESADKLAACSARSLVEKAEVAFDVAWRSLAPTPDFVGKPRPRMSFRTARILAKGGVRYEMADRAQAAFLSHASVSAAFSKAFGDVTCDGQGAVVLLHCAPVEWTPEDPASLRALESENQLERGTIVSAAWHKAPHLRKPDQVSAVVKIWLRSQKIADDLIILGGQLLNAPVIFRMIRQEPTRCYKCQRYGHKGAKCKALYDVCSGCGGPHKGLDCDKPEASHCVSCDSDNHCSWDRKCPIFRAETEKLKRSRPDSSSLLYNPDREAELAVPRARPVLLAPATLGDAMASVASGSNLRPVRNTKTHQPRISLAAQAQRDRPQGTTEDTTTVTPQAGILVLGPDTMGAPTPSNPPFSPSYPLRPISPSSVSSTSDSTV